MAAPSASAVIADKFQFSNSFGDPNNRQWFPDERDGFISWLKSEFAAANTIIDAMILHLRSIGDPGEYDHVIRCITQRRCNWSPVLYMQHYFAVAEVTNALQQVEWRRQQRQFDGPKVAERDMKRPVLEYRPVNRLESATENHRSVDFPSVALDAMNVKKGENNSQKGADGNQKLEGQVPEGNDSLVVVVKEGAVNNYSPKIYCSPKDQENPHERNCGTLEPVVDDCSNPNLRATDNDSLHQGNEAKPDVQKLVPVPKVFVGNETRDGKMVNAVEGLKMYNGLFNDSEIAKLTSMASDMRASGHRGELQGQTMVISKRPMRGHGRDLIQLGVPISEGPLKDGTAFGNSNERNVEPVPSFLQEIFDRLLQLQVLAVKPDFCVIDFFNQGDHSRPYYWPQWYGRPVCSLFLTDCDMVFGGAVAVDQWGDYKGSLRLSLTSGDLLVMEGKSRHLARHAIPSIDKHRILLIFGKSQLRKAPRSDSLRFPPSIPAISSPWGHPPSTRPPTLVRHPPGPNHVVHIPPSSGMQPLFIAPAAVAMPNFPQPVAMPPQLAGWAAVPAHPRHPAPRQPVPGTGVFLRKQGLGGASPPQQLWASAEGSHLADADNEKVGVGESNGSDGSSLKIIGDGSGVRSNCNRNLSTDGRVSNGDQQNVGAMEKVSISAAK